MYSLQTAARLVFVFVGDDTWRSQKRLSKHRSPPKLVAVEVFISKSAWYNQKNAFATVKKSYSSMVEWLNREGSDEDEDREVWGDYREKYTLEDLKEYLDLGGRLERTQRSSQSPNKGKGKSHKKYN